MRSIIKVLLLIFIMTTAGCQTYSISEAEVNRKIESRLANDDIRLNKSYKGLKIQYQIKKLTFDFQENDGGKVVIYSYGTIEGEIKVLGRNINISTPYNPVMSSSLKYHNGNVYLTNVVFMATKNSLPKFLKLSINSFNEMAVDILQQTPIYTLNHSLKEKISSKMIKEIKIYNNKLIFKIT